MAGLNAAFERVAAAAEKRLESETKRQTGAIEGVGKKQIQEVERVGRRIQAEAKRALQDGLKLAVANADALATELGIQGAKNLSDFRRALDTLDGAARGAGTGAAAGAAIGTILGGPVGGVVGTAGGGALGLLVGGGQGYTVEDGRKLALRIRHELEREAVELQRLFANLERDADRIRATRRNSGRVG